MLVFLIFLTLIFSQQNNISDNLNDNITLTNDLDSTVNFEVDIFDDQLYEAKVLLSDAIISDITGDTISAKYQFEQLFESMYGLDAIANKDGKQEIELNKMIKTAIDYYEKQSISLSKIETGFSTALFKDKLNQYIYDQKLEEVEYVDEKVEIIAGGIPITYNQKVESIIKFYKTDGRRSIQKWLNRMDRYKKIVLPILEDEGVPLDLFYLCMIESGLNPNAYSYAHASGLWQFIASTGKGYNLNNDWWIDERRDFEKSTVAAATYLKDLHDEFGDWYLAFAAYNAGSSRVHREMRRSNSNNFWELYRLPGQTKNYVPTIMAALFIAKNPSKYGFSVNPEPSLEWTIKKINKSVSLESLSKCAGLNTKVLKSYNPELKQGIIPPIEGDNFYEFRLPITASSNFDSLYGLLEEEKVQKIIDHKVRRGDNLTSLAKKYNSTVKAIREINKIKTNTIQIGWKLKIPTKGYMESQKNIQRKIYYKVKNGDTLSEIAEDNRTSVRKIKQWNGLRSNTIRVGQKLVIYKN